MTRIMIVGGRYATAKHDRARAMRLVPVPSHVICHCRPGMETYAAEWFRGFFVPVVTKPDDMTAFRWHMHLVDLAMNRQIDRLIYFESGSPEPDQIKAICTNSLIPVTAIEVARP